MFGKIECFRIADSILYSTMSLFVSGRCIVVTVRGPGKLYLLSWQSNAGAPSCVGATPTANSGITRYMLSFSHTYERFAFYWEGQGEAVYSIGTELLTHNVGRGWREASFIAWGASSIITQDVTGVVGTAVNRDNQTTCFIIPDKI